MVLLLSRKAAKDAQSPQTHAVVVCLISISALPLLTFS
ncbi:MAG: hypothetical protein K0Q79_1255 [Flavipsychrobacter sp.]|jgi:hypothetical protein|nr:hypothetical protein [Flavipsychrobacter sp.]